ncbi:hypothetical protein B0G38_000311 [Arthrobacter sp. VKM Ac-2550]|nr:hypothetical protein [Arthrobacter sp. VKM Ac-2550]
MHPLPTEVVKPKDHVASDITVLEGIESARKRRDMYMGSTRSRRLHLLVYEVVDNPIDEALAGYCNTIDIELADSSSRYR